MDNRIAEIQRRLEAATPFEDSDVMRYDSRGGRLAITRPDHYRQLIADFYTHDDREFFAHAPSDIKYLLDRIRELEGK